MRRRINLLSGQLAGSRALVERLRATPTPEDLWMEVRVSEEGQAARHFRRMYGRASATIGEQRGTIARLRMELANTRQHVERSRDAATVAAAERHGDEIGQRDRTAAIEGAATTLRAHILDPHGPRASCRCGWGRELITAYNGSRYWPGPDEYARHVAEQLAAVGALGDREPVAAQPLLADRHEDEWWPTVGGSYIRRTSPPRSRGYVEEQYGPVIERFES